MHQKKIIIWTKNIDNLINDYQLVGGLTVQMFFWAKTFNLNKWKVYSFSETKKCKLNDIHFLRFPTIRFVGIFIEVIYSLFYILKIKPDVIFYRGASRGLSYVSVFSRIVNSKLVFLGASDLNFLPNKEYINSLHDKLLYRMGLRNSFYFIVQNTFQKKMLRENYGKTSSILIPNIWTELPELRDEKKKNEKFILWVSNFRYLKRPEWFLELAKQHPKENFVMVGSPLDIELYNKCKKAADSIKNLTFLGGRGFNFVNELFKSTKIFVCTSEVEGFPNTFLQAWANNVPVLSTFDPSNIIFNNSLGKIVSDQTGLSNGLNLLNIDTNYKIIQHNIMKYFQNNHNSQKAYMDVIEMLNYSDTSKTNIQSSLDV